MNAVRHVSDCPHHVSDCPDPPALESGGGSPFLGAVCIQWLPQPCDSPFVFRRVVLDSAQRTLVLAQDQPLASIPSVSACTQGGLCSMPRHHWLNPRSPLHWRLRRSDPGPRPVSSNPSKKLRSLMPHCCFVLHRHTYQASSLYLQVHLPLKSRL